MPRKSIKRAQPWTISLAYGPNGESRYYVGPINNAEEAKFDTFRDAKDYVNGTIWRELWRECLRNAQWHSSDATIASYMRMQQNSNRCWTVYPTIERLPKKLKMSGINAVSSYLIRLPGSSRWRRVKTDWHGITANHHIYVSGPEGALRIDLQ